MGISNFDKYVITDHAVKRASERFGINEKYVKEWFNNISFRSNKISTSQEVENREVWGDENISIVLDIKKFTIVTVFPTPNEYRNASFTNSINYESINRIVDVIKRERDSSMKSNLQKIQIESKKMSNIHLRDSDKTHLAIKDISDKIQLAITNEKQAEYAFGTLLEMLTPPVIEDVTPKVLQIESKQNGEKEFSITDPTFEIIKYIKNNFNLEINDIAEKLNKTNAVVRNWETGTQNANKKNQKLLFDTFGLKYSI
jgi:DNA-binding transcriptional regulator YiaG